MEEEIKNTQGKTVENRLKTLEEKTTSLQDEIKKVKSCKKLIKPVFILLLMIVIFGGFILLITSYYNSKYQYQPKENCCEIEKNCTIKEAESQNKIAELEKEICGLKEKLNKPLLKQTIKNQQKDDCNKSKI